MPKRKKEPILTGGEVATIEAMHSHPDAERIGKEMSDAVDKVIASKLCGHINRHFTNYEGKREGLACTLPKGHDGDHSAPHLSLAEFSGEKDPDQLYKFRGGKYYLVVESVGSWNDMAGTPIENIQPDYEGYPDRMAWAAARAEARARKARGET